MNSDTEYKFNRRELEVLKKSLTFHLNELNRLVEAGLVGDDIFVHESLGINEINLILKRITEALMSKEEYLRLHGGPISGVRG